MQWLMSLLGRRKNANILQLTRRRGIMMSLFALAAGATAVGVSRRASLKQVASRFFR